MALHQANTQEKHRALESYYRMHAGIYDLTRWSFLWGREALVRRVAACHSPTRILEVGCGTGKNLGHLGRLFPQAQLWGLDLSADMLGVAGKKLRDLAHRLNLVQASYDRPVAEEPFFDLVVFSYALSMFNPGWEEAVEAAGQDLIPGGAMAVAREIMNAALAGFTMGARTRRLLPRNRWSCGSMAALEASTAEARCAKKAR